jgi:peptide/nickel transport system permease protein
MTAPQTQPPQAPAAAREPGALARFFDSDVWWSFTRSPSVMIAAAVTALIVLAALFAPWVAPSDPTDLAKLDLMDSRIPPVWLEGGEGRFLLGSDNQGRDMLSAILYGLRISIGVSLSAVALAMTIGVTAGLLAGYLGGWVDTAIMRVADVQLTFPAILTALIINGVARALFGTASVEGSEFWILVISIGLSYWVQYARTVRGSTLVEKNKDYVQAARLIGIRPLAIMFRHVLPNVLGPVLVIATINLALAIITEATLSFLGVGLPPTHPSLGTLVRVGNDFLMSGEWWIALFPGFALAVLALAVNMLGDWLRDALNPKLR